MSAPARFAMMVFAGSLIFIGLPLVGWGVTDIQGFLDEPARFAYIVVVIALQVVVGLLFPGVGRSGGDGTKLVRRQRFAVILLQVLSLAMVLVSPWSDHHKVAVITGAVDIVRAAGLILFVAGFLLMNWSEAMLGKQFSIQVTIQENHRLITAGPYRLLRHPRYLGIVVFNLGIALVFRSWLALILVAVLLGVLLWRIHDEEILMRQEFGSEWDTYSRGSWHLIPYVY